MVNDSDGTPQSNWVGRDAPDARIAGDVGDARVEIADVAAAAIELQADRVEEVVVREREAHGHVPRGRG